MTVEKIIRDLLADMAASPDLRLKAFIPSVSRAKAYLAESQSVFDAADPLADICARHAQGKGGWLTYEAAGAILAMLSEQRLDAATVERCARVDNEDMRKLREATDLWLKQIGYPRHWPNSEVRAVIAAIGRVLAPEPHQHGAGNGGEA